MIAKKYEYFTRQFGDHWPTNLYRKSNRRERLAYVSSELIMGIDGKNREEYRWSRSGYTSKTTAITLVPITKEEALVLYPKYTDLIK